VLAPDPTDEEEPKKRTKQKVPATKTEKVAGSKRKKNGDASSDSDVQPAAKARKKETAAGVTKSSKSITHRPATKTPDTLLSLPGEVLNMILKKVG
jgi:hypothetical protein